MKRKILNLLMLLCISANVFANYFNAVNSDGKTIYYNITSSIQRTVSVTFNGSAYDQYSNEYIGVINIPESVTFYGNTYSVTSIEDNAFRGCSGLTSITIPNSVTSIGARAFEGCSALTTLNWNAKNCTSVGSSYSSSAFYNLTSLTQVNIGDSVEVLPAYFLYGCSGLTSITIPNSVTSIGDSAFKGCTGLTTLNWNAKNCISVGSSYSSSAFYNLTNLTQVNIGDSVEVLPEYFLYGCSGLTSVTIGNSVTSIGEEAFEGCSGLTSVTIGNSVTSIGEEAFEGCSGLTNITIPNSVTSIGYRAFYGCSGLTSITIPNSVTSIGDAAFSGCTGLTSVTIGNSVTSIGEYAFYGCSGLTSITIPNSVTSIGVRAFKGCSGLTTLNWNAKNCTSVGSYDFISHSYYNAFYNLTSLTQVNIGDSVEVLPASFLVGCSGLTSVTIGNSVTSIGDSAFKGCTGLTTLNWNAKNCISVGSSYSSSAFYNLTSLTQVNIGDSVEVLPAYFLYGCSGLTNITIPNSVTIIKWNAFQGCSGLTSITIGNSVTIIGEEAFVGCSGLTTLNWNAKNCTSVGYYWPAFYNLTSLTQVNIGDSVEVLPASFLVGCSGLTSITIPNSVTSIGEKAFVGCSGLTSITIPNSVTSIGNSAFEGCNALTTLNWNAKNCTSVGSYDFSRHRYYPAFYNLTSLTQVNIGDSVEVIPPYFLYGCSGLTGIVIPNRVTSVGDYAFRDCSGLTSITIPNSVTSIGNYAFEDCSGLTSITIPNSVTSIGNSAFCGCSGLTSVTIGNSVTSIGNKAFYDCSGLTSVTIGNSVTSIGAEAFRGCSSLTSITIPNSVTSIGSSAFSGCTGLTEITCNANPAPSLGSSHVFDNVNTQIPVYIPCGSLTSYSSTWLRFSNFIEEQGYSFSAQSNDTTMGSVIVLTQPTCTSSQAVVKAVANNGYHFDHWSNGVTTNPYTFTLTQDTSLSAYFVLSDEFTAVNSAGKTIYYKVTSSLEPRTVKVTYQGSAYDEYSNEYIGVINIPESVTYYANTYSVTSIGDNAFRGCSGLTSITIPNSVTSIGENAFSGCTNLANIVVSQGNTVYDSRSNCKAIIKTSTNKLILGCKNTTIPNSVTSIGDYAFRDCSGLTSITIPSSVTSIGKLSFNNCTSLTSVTIGINVTSIGDYAFMGCDIDTLRVKSENPPTIESHTIDKVNVILVPCGLAGVYKIAPNWKNFKNNIKEDCNVGLYEFAEETGIVVYPNPVMDNAVLSIDNLKEDVKVILTDEQGRQVSLSTMKAGEREINLNTSSLANGIYFVRIVGETIQRTEKIIKK